MSDLDLKTFPQYFYSTCSKYPDSPAQRFNPDLYHGDGGGSFTYAAMRQRVEAIAGGLLSLGLAQQQKVAIMAPSSPYWTHADMALSNCGAVSVTIYPTLSTEEVVYIVNDSGSRFLFAGNAEVLATVEAGRARMPGLEKIFVLDLAFESRGDVLGLSDLIARGGEWLKDHADEYRRRWESVSLDDCFTILYTSGTTGQGKGVILSHGCGSSRMEGVRAYFARFGMTITPADVTLCFLPLSHIFDRGSCQLMAICDGACIAYADKPGTLLADMQKYNPTWINCVPRLYEKIYITFQQQMAASALKQKLFDWALQVGEKALEYRTDENGCIDMSPDFDLKSRLPLALRLRFAVADRLFAKVRALFGSRFRYSFSASAGISPDLLRFYYTLGLAVVEGYGSTESFNACVLNPINACKPGYMGKEANGSRARVAIDGELEVSGAGIFREYLNKPEETAASFTEDGWFKTGDIVERDNQGYYRIVDRKKAIICTSGGKNIAPAKLENLFATSQYVEQVFFVGSERPFIAALVVPSFNYFIDLFEREGIAYDRERLRFSDSTGVRICIEVGDDFIAQPRLRELIDGEIRAANARLEKFEAVRKYTILNRRFTEENGFLTPTQKTKKRVIIAEFMPLIDAMYVE